MGPPLNIWPSDHRSAENDSDRASDRSYFGREHLIVRVVRDIHVIHKLTIALVLLQIILNLNIVLAGPVLLNAHNLQGEGCRCTWAAVTPMARIAVAGMATAMRAICHSKPYKKWRLQPSYRHEVQKRIQKN
ncbi:hypothetical protein EVAR_50688_1 [Eumeta japonica]|uniref:Uncharacterized protein n=1 Tax=Eumeta variegata TaxID=151549 RepID=A0A4C1XQZ4_EUMVA|nr:hypothetical protein EVAR_50688_1 [Eumeta japonica]